MEILPPTTPAWYCLANGLADNEKIKEKNEDYETFCEALYYVNEALAKMMAGDGEGATALFEVKVVRAASKEDAVILSKSVVTQALPRLQSLDMMLTGEESYVHWAIPAWNLIRSRLTFTLKVQPAS